jgi:hypothetical protein
MRTLIDDVTAGIVGAITVAGWFLMLDVARGQPFATPALLGATLMHGAVDPRLVHVTWTLVVEYSVIHVTAFVAFGLVAAWLLTFPRAGGFHVPSASRQLREHVPCLCSEDCGFRLSVSAGHFNRD